MADSKKTTAKKPAVTQKSLEEQLAEKQADLMAAKQSHRAGELVNPRVLGTIRKEIARLHTAIRAAEKSEKESK